MSAAPLAFVDRVGGVLVSPRAQLARVAAGEGGLGDVLWLFGLRLLAGESAPLIARALLSARTLGPLAAVQGVLQAVATLLPDAIGILVGAVALSLIGAAVSSGARRMRGRELDLAASAWIPFLSVRVAAALLFSALGREPSRVESWVVTGLSLGWAAVVYAMAFLVEDRGPTSGGAAGTEASR